MAKYYKREPPRQEQSFSFRQSSKIKVNNSFVSFMMEQIAILDFGSQYTQVIARRIREANVYCTILRYDMPATELAALAPKGIVLSGGPASVYSPDAPLPDAKIFELGI